MFDYSDLPLNENYIDSICEITGGFLKESRWMNAIAVYANTKNINTIEKINFVKEVIPIELKSKVTRINSNSAFYGKKIELLRKQLELFDGSLFIDSNINGKGVRIAIFDAGFPNLENNPVFKHITEEGRIIKTYDFIKNSEHLGRGLAHGTMVFGCIAGIADSGNIGLATGAEFLLARTEGLLELYCEEENWLAAVEWADKNGADIINSSLGYTYHRYFPNDMDGNTSLVARAANMAASKGILVINAMGNDGTSSWKVLSTPADADSVLSVGGVYPFLEYHITFSSFGPTSDFKLKPNVAASGEAITFKHTKIGRVFGTSVATPLITGFAACVWQMHPEMNNMEIFKEIEKSASLYPYYDYGHGYGIPKAGYFFNPNDSIEQTFELNIIDDTLKINVFEEFIDIDHPNFYYHIENTDHFLREYSVIEVSSSEVIKLPVEEFEEKEIIRIHYNGYTLEHEF